MIYYCCFLKYVSTSVQTLICAINYTHYDLLQLILCTEKPFDKDFTCKILLPKIDTFTKLEDKNLCKDILDLFVRKTKNESLENKSWTIYKLNILNILSYTNIKIRIQFYFGDKYVPRYFVITDKVLEYGFTIWSVYCTCPRYIINKLMDCFIKIDEINDILIKLDELILQEKIILQEKNSSENFIRYDIDRSYIDRSNIDRSNIDRSYIDNSNIGSSKTENSFKNENEKLVHDLLKTYKKSLKTDFDFKFKIYAKLINKMKLRGEFYNLDQKNENLISFEINEKMAYLMEEIKDFFVSVDIDISKFNKFSYLINKYLKIDTNLILIKNRKHYKTDNCSEEVKNTYYETYLEENIETRL